MAKGLQTSVQYLLIILGVIVVLLAVWMAKENMWWLAVPDAIFGIGIGWFAWIGIHEHEVHPVAAVETGPQPDAPPPPPPPAAIESHEAEAHPEPAAVAAAPPASPTLQPARSRKKKKRRH